MGVITIRADLGFRALLTEWRAMFRREHLRADVLAALALVCVAVPLSLAIALASSVSPSVGLVTAIVGGILCALFGGTPLAVSGPAAAMAVVMGSIVEQHGARGLAVVVIVSGVLQLLTGVLGLGRIVRLVPLSVVEGFTAGIGAIILIGQLPRVLGLPPPDEAHVIEVLRHVRELIHRARPASVVISLSSLGITLLCTRFIPKLPGALLAIVIPTVVVAALGTRVDSIGALPASLPRPTVPWVSGSMFYALLSSAILVYALGSLETLLSSTAVDKLSRGRHDPDQELIGQGIGNMVAALFGGLAVTGVIARSALNVQAGGKTRRAALLHGVFLVFVVYFAGRLIARIPIAALAGLLFSVALRMLDPRKLRTLYRVSRGDAAVYGATFGLIVALDLVKGIGWGLAAAMVVAALRLGATSEIRLMDSSGALRVSVSGAVTFLASLRFDRLRAKLERLPSSTEVTIDLSGVTVMDASGAETIADIVAALKARDFDVAVVGLRADFAAMVKSSDHSNVVNASLAATEAEAARILDRHEHLDGKQRLQVGVDHYRRVHLPKYAELFRSLAKQQTPHTLFITCSDSRIQPNLLTSADPGELFIIRNIGNVVPSFDPLHASSTGAGVEFAVAALGVSEVVVCAHSSCGAMKALRGKAQMPSDTPTLSAWVQTTEARELCEAIPKSVGVDDVARLSALRQLDHLNTYSVIAERVSKGTLGLHAWFFHIGSGEVEEWHPESESWVTVAAEVERRPSMPLIGVSRPTG